MNYSLYAGNVELSCIDQMVVMVAAYNWFSRRSFTMAYVIRHIVNQGNAVELGERLSDQGPFDTREQAEQRLNELERDKAKGKFAIEELVLS